MKITKGAPVNASIEAELMEVNTGIQDAIGYIKSAIDTLALESEDQVCKEAIANLSVVILDLESVDSQVFPSLEEEAVVDPVVEDSFEEEIIEEL